MSSVARSFSQLSKRTLWSEDGPYIHTFSDFQTRFAAGNPEYVGNLILFENDTLLGEAIYNLEDAADSASKYTDSHTSLLDLGKTVYVGLKGVNGGDSIKFTYRLVRQEGGNSYNFNQTAGGVYYVLVGATGITSDLYSALDGYGEVWVGTGAA